MANAPTLAMAHQALIEARRRQALDDLPARITAGADHAA